MQTHWQHAMFMQPGVPCAAQQSPAAGQFACPDVLAGARSTAPQMPTNAPHRRTPERSNIAPTSVASGFKLSFFQSLRARTLGTGRAGIRPGASTERVVRQLGGTWGADVVVSRGEFSARTLAAVDWKPTRLNDRAITCAASGALIGRAGQPRWPLDDRLAALLRSPSLLPGLHPGCFRDGRRQRQPLTGAGRRPFVGVRATPYSEPECSNTSTKGRPRVLGSILRLSRPDREPTAGVCCNCCDVTGTFPLQHAAQRAYRRRATATPKLLAQYGCCQDPSEQFSSHSDEIAAAGEAATGASRPF